MMIACNECKNNCNKCNYDYLCEYYMGISNNVPIIQGGLFVSDTTKRDAIKSQLKVIK